MDMFVRGVSGKGERDRPLRPKRRIEKNGITQEMVRELFDYNPNTGSLTIKRRGREWFDTDKDWRRYNSTHEGQVIVRGSRIFRKQFSSAEIIWLWMTGTYPDEVNRKNHNKHDHRWVNLRSITRQQCIKSRRLFRNSSFLYHGIRELPNGMFKASIKDDGRIVRLGRFDSFSKALKARKEAEKRYGYMPEHGYPSRAKAS
jgi:hypothetical protein